MKINQDLRLNVDNTRPEQKQHPGSGAKFNTLVQKQEHQLQLGQLQQLMKEVDAAGERLAKSKNFRDLSKFKSLVKQFVKEAVNFGMELKHSHSWNQFGEGRPLKLVATIDDKLIELADDMMDKKGAQVELRGKIGESWGRIVKL